ncbi:hypothetical protein DFH11DRAFT_1741821 [Phellopilus nigrolimitatus]|nr:hypothetical protein DFH11DRAFT_1741821 [Phellopilus nigrolimitatus]
MTIIVPASTPASAAAMTDTRSPSPTSVTEQPVDVESATQPQSNATPSNEVTMSEHVYKYKVKMTCGGCSGAIERVLAKAQREGAGVDSYTVSLDAQSVDVKGAIAFDELTRRIEKTGKQILEANEVGALAADESAEQVSLAAAPVAVV